MVHCHSVGAGVGLLLGVVFSLPTLAVLIQSFIPQSLVWEHNTYYPIAISDLEWSVCVSWLSYPGWVGNINARHLQDGILKFNFKCL